MKGPRKLSVPASILLAGEYAILEPGGLGVALAPRIRLTATVEPARRWSLEGHWTRGQDRWKEGEAPVTAASRMLAETLALPEVAYHQKPARLRLDSQAFFDEAGRKKGFGSSGAVACAVAAAVLYRCGFTDQAIRELGPRLAVRAHRLAQGGQGSGYDVMTSFSGGLSVFVGGTYPETFPLPLSWLPSLHLFPGLEAVRTVKAIEAWRAFQSTDPDEAAAYVANNNYLVVGLARSASWNEARKILESLKRNGQDLGEKIGVPADLDPRAYPEFQDPSGKAFWKASGAGNETGLLASDQVLPSPFLPLTPDTNGLKWEEPT